MTIAIEKLSELLSHSLGAAKALDEVSLALASHGFADSKCVTREQAIEVLETIAQRPGIVGITARFAKSRLYFL